MESVILASIIGAVGTISASFVAVLFKREKKLAEEKIDKIESAISTSSDEFSNAAPYSLDLVKKTVTLEKNGDAKQNQEWHNLCPNQKFNRIQVPIKFTVDGNNASFGEIEGGELPSSSMPVKLIIHEEDDLKGHKKIEGCFEIIGLSTPETNDISFYLDQEVKKAFRKTKEETLSAYQNTEWQTEYTSSRVIFPTNRLELTTRFPNSYDLKIIRPNFVVFMGGTHIVNGLETERVRSGFKILKQEVNLTVEKPIVGLSYAITWMPPPRG